MPHLSDASPFILDKRVCELAERLFGGMHLLRSMLDSRV